MKRTKDLLSRIVYPVILIFIIFLVLSAVLNYYFSYNRVIDSGIVNAENTVYQIKTLRAYYTDKVVADVRNISDVKIGINHDEDPKIIPLPATMIHDLSKKFSDSKSGMSVSLYSEFPFSNRKNRVIDSFQKDSLEYFKKNSDSTFTRTEGSWINKKVRIAIPDKMVNETCVGCHNSHPDSPKKDWKIGEIRGVLEVSVPIQEELFSITKSSFLLFLLGIFSVFIVYFVLRSIVNNTTKIPFEILGKALGSNANSLNEISHHLKKSSDELVQSSSEQASAVQESVAAMEEMSSMINQTKSVTIASKESSESVKLMTNDGDVIMGQLGTSMERISNNNKNLKAMESIISNIYTKTHVIHDIVFKTQLLSFNASIEAARAGQHGKGFAVVAEEVGKLSRVSGEAAVEITRLLEESQIKVRDLIQETSQTVEEGQIVSEKAQDIFRQISIQIESINSQIESIMVATNEQVLGVEQTTQGLQLIDSSMNLNQHTAIGNSTSADKLGELAQEIIKLNSQFNDLLNGNHD